MLLSKFLNLKVRDSLLVIRITVVIIELKHAVVAFRCSGLPRDENRVEQVVQRLKLVF